MMTEKKEPRGGAGRGQGRNTREENGLEPVRQTTVKIEPSIAAICREKYGSLSKALRFAANHKTY